MRGQISIEECMNQREREQRELFNTLVIDVERERSKKDSKVRKAEIEGMAEGIVAVLENSYIPRSMAVEIVGRAGEILEGRYYE